MEVSTSVCVSYRQMYQTPLLVLWISSPMQLAALGDATYLASVYQFNHTDVLYGLMPRVYQ